MSVRAVIHLTAGCRPLISGAQSEMRPLIVSSTDSKSRKLCSSLDHQQYSTCVPPFLGYVVRLCAPWYVNAAVSSSSVVILDNRQDRPATDARATNWGALILESDWYLNVDGTQHGNAGSSRYLVAKIEPNQTSLSARVASACGRTVPMAVGTESPAGELFVALLDTPSDRHDSLKKKTG
jgi:hypothetical protein